MIRNNPPCIRDLYKFRKTGCPGKKWDGVEGCMAWIEQAYDNVDPMKETVIVKSCIDLLSYDIKLKMLTLLEGNQVATESLRNGLCETVNGQTVPKPDPALHHMICLMTQSHNNKLIS